VQTEDYADRSEFFADDYAYFSSFSKSWLAHAEQYVSDVASRFQLNDRSLVVEVASNDGYLLQYVLRRGIPCLGVEPTASTAAAARAKGIPVDEVFFGRETADVLSAQGKAADLMVANNVLAHVPDINDFVRGFARLLKPGGVATFEFPHLLSLVRYRQFDTIYHEHYSYLSLTAVTRIFAECGLSVFDVEKIATHGGSLRVFAQRADTSPFAIETRVADVLKEEFAAGVSTPAFYDGFQTHVEEVKNAFLTFLLQAAREGKRVFAYGAAAKGNTLLNFAGVRRDLVRAVADANPAKSGKFLPGSRIPIITPQDLIEARPDFIIIFPWNLKEEIMNQLSVARDWGARFVTAIPSLTIHA